MHFIVIAELKHLKKQKKNPTSQPARANKY